MTENEIEVKVHSSFNYQKWVIETKLPEWEDTLKYWNEATDVTNVDETASNVATQVYFKDSEGLELAELLRNNINNILTSVEAPIRAGKLKIAWTLGASQSPIFSITTRISPSRWFRAFFCFRKRTTGISLEASYSRSHFSFITEGDIISSA